MQKHHGTGALIGQDEMEGLAPVELTGSFMGTDMSALFTQTSLDPASSLVAPATVQEEPKLGVEKAIKRVVMASGGERQGAELARFEGQEVLNITEKEYQSIGEHWTFNKKRKGFIRCPGCTSQVKICNLAKHIRKSHSMPKCQAKVNQVRGCQACGADNVPVELLESHQNCSIENCQSIPIKFVSSDATFIKSVKKTTSMNQIKKDVSRTMGVLQPEEIKLFLNNKKLVSNDIPGLLHMKKNEVIRVWKCNENPKFPIVKKRKACDGPDQVTYPKVSKLIQDSSNEPISVHPTTSLDVLGAWVFAPNSLYGATCPECGYIPAPTRGALYKHMGQHHPEVSGQPRTCDKCGFKVSPKEVENHFQNHNNVLAKMVYKSINPQTHPAPTLSPSPGIYIEEQTTTMTPKELGMAALNYTDEQKAAVVKEVIEDHCSPKDLEKKYKICAWNIKDWVRIADNRLPESYGMETLKGSATEGQECVTLSSSEEDEAVMERDVTEWKVNETGTTEYKEDVEDVKDGEITGRNQRPNQTFSRLDGSSLSSEPSVASTSRSFPGASLCLQAPAAASAEVKDQLSKPSLDVLGAWVLAPNSLYRAKCPECGYIPALTLGVLYQHMVQHHPEVSERPRTCDMCGINVSPNEVEKHFQKHDNILAKKVSKSIYPQTWVRKAGRWVPKQYKKSLPKAAGQPGATIDILQQA